MSERNVHERITIWRWGDAPAVYEALSGHGGDEDWVVHVPKSMRDYTLPGELARIADEDEYETSYMVYWGHVDRHELDNGDVVVIFAHA